MKLDLDALNYLYDYLDDEDRLTEDITNFEEFKNYILTTIISNIEYDFGINFQDYVDYNNFVIEE